MEVREILEQVKNGKISLEDAVKFFKRQPFEEMGYAKLDTHRLLAKVEVLQEANCVVAVAGMEGALASRMITI